MNGIPSWQPDPTGRFTWRYWDGERWTDNVSNGGDQTVDPLRPGATPATGSAGALAGLWAPPPHPSVASKGLTTMAKVLIFGGLATALVAVAIAAFALRAFVLQVKGPVDEANRYFDDLERGDFAAAYDRQCRATKSEVPQETWTANFLDGLAGDVIVGHEVYGSSVRGGVAVTDVTAHTRADTYQLELRLVKEDGGWRPCGLRQLDQIDLQ